MKQVIQWAHLTVATAVLSLAFAGPGFADSGTDFTDLDHVTAKDKIISLHENYFTNADDKAWYSASFITAAVHHLDLPKSLDPNQSVTREEFTHLPKQIITREQAAEEIYNAMEYLKLHSHSDAAAMENMTTSEGVLFS